MKYTLVNTNLCSGGAERQALLLLKEFALLGLETELVLLEAQGQWISDVPPSVRVVGLTQARPRGSLLGKLRWLMSANRKLRQHLKKNETDVIITFLWLPTLLIAWHKLKNPRTAKLVWSVQTDVVNSLRGRLGGRVARFALNRVVPRCVDLFISPSTSIKRKTDEIFNHFLRPSVVVPNAASVDTFDKNTPGPSEIRTVFTIVSVGRLHPAKNFSMLLEVVKSLKGRLPAIKCLIVGEGPLLKTLSAQAAALSVADAVEFVGYSASPGRWLEKGDVFVSCSAWETFGVAIAEAMTCGLPIVASATDGARDLVKEGENGFLIEDSSIDKFASALVHLAMHPEDRRRMGDVAIGMARGFDPQVVAGKYLSAIESLEC